MNYRLELFNQTHEIEIINNNNNDNYDIIIDGQLFKSKDIKKFINIDISRLKDQFILTDNNQTLHVLFKKLNISSNSPNNNLNTNNEQAKEFFKDGLLIAPLPGKIIDIKCKIGDEINVGKIIIVLEAMKMENEIVCPFKIKITDISVLLGESVTEKQQLLKYSLINS